jgi:KDO2-lipid IV(A) lauroyltransferase
MTIYNFFWNFAYRIGILLSNILPRRVLFMIANFSAFFWWLLNYNDRNIVETNLKNILGDSFNKRTSYSVFKNFACYLIDFFRLHKLNKNFIKNYIKIYNLELVKEMFKLKRGVIGLTAHIGNWELGGAVLSKLSFPVSVIAFSHRVNYVDRFFKKQRESVGIEVLPVKDSFQTSVKKLKENRLLAILADRDFSIQANKVKFFNRLAYLPHSPALLAIRANAPLIFGFVIRKGLNYKIFFEGPIFPPDRDLKLKDKKKIILSKIVKELEKYIKLYPDQWLIFQKYWELPKIETVI